MKLFTYDFATHQPYLEKNTVYTENMPVKADPLFSQIWAVYQVDHFDKSKSMAFPDICADLMVFYTDKAAYSYIATGTEDCRSMAAEFSFLEECNTIFGIKFFPGRLNHFCLSDVQDSGSRAVEAEKVLVGGKDVLGRLSQAQTFQERWEMMRDFLLRRLASRQKEDSIAAYTAACIVRSHGNQRLAQLEQLTGYSDRYLRKKFQEELGISLKKFSEIVRMQWAYELYQKHPEMKMIDLAMESGYYDQSHMNSKFKKLTGMLPKEALNMYAA